MTHNVCHKQEETCESSWAGGARVELKLAIWRVKFPAGAGGGGKTLGCRPTGVFFPTLLKEATTALKILWIQCMCIDDPRIGDYFLSWRKVTPRMEGIWYDQLLIAITKCQCDGSVDVYSPIDRHAWCRISKFVIHFDTLHKKAI